MKFKPEDFKFEEMRCSFKRLRQNKESNWGYDEYDVNHLLEYVAFEANARLHEWLKEAPMVYGHYSDDYFLIHTCNSIAIHHDLGEDHPIPTHQAKLVAIEEIK